MKNLKVVFTALWVMSIVSCFAQSKEDVIAQIQKLMLENYIFLDKAEQTNTYLDSLMEVHYFDSFESPRDFARALSVEMQKITKDRHLNVAPSRPPRQRDENADFFSWHLNNLVRFRSGGFGRIDLFEGNVGYVELKGFRREDISKVDDIMEYLSTADAIIIDLRENGGGGALGDYWSSYFLEENTHLSGTYERRTDTKREFYTVPVRGRQRLNMPIFILTSNRTFSAAEAFAYDLQSRKRAIIIGEVTGGGAHPVQYMPLVEGYGLIVPYVESINPVTKTNWEAVGVLPDYQTTKEEALSKAKELASIAAKAYRETPFNELRTILEGVEIKEAAVVDLLELLLERKHLEDFMLTSIGYSYLDRENIRAAHAVFKSCVDIFPQSPNVHDSLAEVLVLMNEKVEALEHYRKAVMLAEEQKDRELDVFKKNLADFEEKYKL